MKEDNTFWELNKNWKKLQESIENPEKPIEDEPESDYHDDNVRATADFKHHEGEPDVYDSPEDEEKPEETPEQPKETSELKTCGSIFSGVGGWEFVAIKIGLKPIFAFEFHQKYADIYKKSHGDHVTVGDVKLTKGQLGQSSVDVLFSSPPCQNYSVAKMNKNDERADSSKDVGLVTIEIAQKTNAKVILIENVIAYMDSPVLQQITKALSPNYHTHVQKVYAQEYGCPTSRLRMIATFVRKDLFGGPFIPKPTVSKQDNARNWYDCVRDLIPNLEKGKLSPWQIERLQRWGTQDLQFPLQISGNNVSATAFKAGKKVRVFRQANEPSFTIVKSWQAMQQTRIMIDENTVLKADPHCFARWQSFPDEIFANLPEDPKTSTEIIGNAVPPQLAFSILQQLIK